MTISTNMIWLILGCMLVTLLPRIIPFIFVRSVQMPEVVLKWLSYIPVCILTALVTESMLQDTGSLLRFDWYVVIALIPSVITAVWTKSLSLTVIIGVACMALLRFMM
ncbi:AzlD domain-containing protein [Paenibacillus gallinarum]|uniref:AzlD domain-containing protein n=1 Tax=Paenibacillus gallinarum TaxID=2762232 RepID=A0ABR8SY00_9BACL|nr:AzlD domain-containing protein [Paenibacillus gallinarum]MBD7968391.1 AzlD domain-containing protein [Paenibacillus gallinarum]